MPSLCTRRVTSLFTPPGDASALGPIGCAIVGQPLEAEARGRMVPDDDHRDKGMPLSQPGKHMLNGAIRACRGHEHVWPDFIPCGPLGHSRVILPARFLVDPSGTDFWREDVARASNAA